ncbi:MAG TPA: alpha/beta hydrolase fold domain-containing protein, partial [Bradyrhizobium sp.]|uniref:alpha/beta hydrolase n=1 Tax=Bradyrhizobium sp. TaxID=376 RepID=UPI002CF59771
SPLYADLANLPPALIIVGTADPLLDDGLLLKQQMLQAGVDTNLILVPNAPHSFNRLPIGLADLLNGHVRRWMLERGSPQ